MADIVTLQARLGEGAYIWSDDLGSSLISVHYTGGSKVRDCGFLTRARQS